MLTNVCWQWGQIDPDGQVEPDRQPGLSLRPCVLVLSLAAEAEITWALYLKTSVHVAAERSVLPSLSMAACSHHSSCGSFQLELPVCQSDQATDLAGQTLFLNVWNNLSKKEGDSLNKEIILWNDSLHLSNFHKNLVWLLDRNTRRLWWSTAFVSVLLTSAWNSESLLTHSESN